MVEVFNSIRRYFYEPFENTVQTTAKKGVYIQAFNFVFLFLYILAVVVRIFTYGNIFLYIGDVIALSALIAGIIFSRCLKVNFAVYTYFAVFGVIFFHNILGDYYFPVNMTNQRLYETMTAMTIGIMCISIFADKYIKLIISYVLSVLIISFHFLVIMVKLSGSDYKDWDYNLISIAIVLITVIFSISVLGMRLNKYLFRINSEKYKTLFNNLSDAFCIIKPEFKNDRMTALKFKEANPVFYTMFRINQQDNIFNEEFTDIIKSAELESFPWHTFIKEIYVNKFEQKFTLFTNKLTGWLHFQVFSTQNDEIVLIISDETSKIVAEKSLNASLREKEHLVKELHHRVKNNFQIISSIMNFNQYGEDEDRFKSIRNRITTMAGIYEHLYTAEDLANIPVKSYVDRLVSHIRASDADNFDSIRFTIDIGNFTCPIYKTIPCALILFEFFDNAIKFSKDASITKVTVFAEKKDNIVQVHLYDDAKSFPENVSIKNPTTPGFIMMNSSLRQLKADYEEYFDEGFHLKIKFHSI